MPPALIQGHRLPPPNRVKNFKMAQANLNKPNLVPAPRNVPKVTATIPRVQPGAVHTGRGRAVTALPAKAIMPLTPQMTQQIQKLPPQRRFEPGKATRPGPGQAIVPGQPGRVQPGAQTKPGPGQPGVPVQPGQFKPGTHTGPAPVQPGAQTKPGRVQPGVPAQPAQVHPGVPAGR